jgi:ADP-heptose:LPS heptosyltransferase
MRNSALWQRPPRRIAVFRALQLGDMLCAVPALRALRLAWPKAEITLIGLPGAKPFAQRFDRYINDLMAFPGVPDFPEQAPRISELDDFYASARQRRFDVAIQMHGTGRIANGIVSRLGADCWTGFVPDQAAAQPGRFMAWPEHLSEPLRYTFLMRHLGIPVYSEDLEFPLTAADRREGWALQARLGFDAAATVFLHAGARLPSRRWPVPRFAAVGRALAQQGYRVAVTGSDSERPLTRALLAELPDDAVDLTGSTSLGSLAALVQACPLLVCNDTGVSHIAAAMGTPSVVVASGSDVNRWAPLNAARHAVLSFPAPCRPCAYHDCPIGHPCALGVSVEQVVCASREKLEVFGRGSALAAMPLRRSKQ